jgi:hypothetical protein
MTSSSPGLGNLGLGTTRLFAVCLGCAAIAWGVYFFPTFWRQSPLEHTAAHIIEGSPFTADVLNELIPAVQATERAEFCQPAGLRSAAIIRLRLAEDAIATSEGDRIDGTLNALRDSIHRSLSCSPADPFLWFVLFWLEDTVNGFSQDQLKFLRLSYELGPNEGWIGLKRNRFAIAVFEPLPLDMREMATNEFTHLIDSGFYREMAVILTGPGWLIRDALLPRLNVVADVQREEFARELYSAGYDVNVPGTSRINPRPWH